MILDCRFPNFVVYALGSLEIISRLLGNKEGFKWTERLVGNNRGMQPRIQDKDVFSRMSYHRILCWDSLEFLHSRLLVKQIEISAFQFLLRHRNVLVEPHCCNLDIKADKNTNPSRPSKNLQCWSGGE